MEAAAVAVDVDELLFCALVHAARLHIITAVIIIAIVLFNIIRTSVRICVLFFVVSILYDVILEAVRNILGICVEFADKPVRIYSDDNLIFLINN